MTMEATQRPEIEAPENRVEAREQASRLSLLSKEQALSEWDVLRKFFDLVIPATFGRRDIESVRAQVEDGRANVVIAWNPDPKAPVIYAAFLIEAEQYIDKKVFLITLCGGGRIEEWGHLLPDFRNMATELGFDQIEINGRPGWSKYVGSKAVRHTFIEELGHE
jgi:hypothetical protein